jgi:hypothetical protein
MLICVCLRILASSRILRYDLGRQTPHFWGSSVTVGTRARLGKTHTKASKNRNNVFSEERLAHIWTLVVSLGGKLTYVLIYATTELHQRRYVVIFEVFILFCCWWPYFIICGPCRTIRICVCLLLLFMNIFGCLCLADRTWVSTSVLVLCGHEWVLRYWSFVDIVWKMMIDVIHLL